jgi:hypothetical protein
MAADEVSFDHANYWGECQRHLPSLRIVDVESSSYLTLLLEAAPFATISRCCANLYSGRALDHVVFVIRSVPSAHTEMGSCFGCAG